MAKYYDKQGNQLEKPDLFKGWVEPIEGKPDSYVYRLYRMYTPEGIATQPPTETEKLRADTDFLLAMGGYV